MKKLFVMLLAAVLLLCGAAMAEEAFTFRDGLHWGMSPDEVQAVEGQEFAESYEFSSRMSMAVIYDGEHLGVEMDQRYLFVDGQLCCFAVDTTMVDQTAFLRAAAIAEYGEPTSPAAPYLVNKYLANSGVSPDASWMPAEDVYIVMLELSYDSISLYYFDTDVDFWAAENDLEPETAPTKTAPAEPTAAGTPFFSGLYMGMSPDEVENALGHDFDAYDHFGSMSAYLIMESVVDGVDCEALSMFYNGRLCIFSIAGPEAVVVLKDSLTAEYGQPSTDAIPYLVDKFTGNSGVTITAGWQPGPDVYAAIIDAYGDEAVYFFDPSIDFWAIENGLEPETSAVTTETAPADETAAPADAFTFRGLTWGMTPEEVEAVEGQSFSGLAADGYTTTFGYLEDLPVSKFEADIQYIFIENGLAGVGIAIDDSIDDLKADADYLLQALTILYGEPQSQDALPAVLFELFFTKRNIDEMYVWLPADDTCIFLLIDDEHWEDISVGYYDISHDWLHHMQTTAPVIIIDTTGL